MGAGCSHKTDPFSGVDVTNVQQYDEANREAVTLASPVFAKVDQGESLSKTDKEDLQKSITLYRGMLNYRPNEAIAHYGIGQAFQALGDQDQAITEFNAFLFGSKDATDPRLKIAQADAHYLISQSLFKLAKYDEAVNEATKALENFPKTANYLAMRASAYVQLKKIPEAKKDIDAALKSDPLNVQAKGLQLLLKGK